MSDAAKLLKIIWENVQYPQKKAPVQYSAGATIKLHLNRRNLLHALHALLLFYQSLQFFKCFELRLHPWWSAPRLTLECAGTRLTFSQGNREVIVVLDAAMLCEGRLGFVQECFDDALDDRPVVVGAFSRAVDGIFEIELFDARVFFVAHSN